MADCDCRAYVDRMLAEKDRWIDAQLSAIQRAVDKAELQMRERLEGMNEMRAQLDRQAGLFATREAVDLLLVPIKTRQDALWDIVNNWQGRLVMVGVLWTAVVLGLSWVLGRKW